MHDKLLTNYRHIAERKMLNWSQSEREKSRRLMKCNNILEAVGRTPLVRLNRINQGLKPQIYVKADYTESRRLREGPHRHHHD